MPKSSRKPPLTSVRPRLRVLCGDDIALGPGKAELLEAIDQTGSLAAAAKRLGMSYMRAWSLLQTMNHCFKSPVVKAARGGSSRGGTELTKTGKKALVLYRKMEEGSQRAAEVFWREMSKLLAD